MVLAIDGQAEEVNDAILTEKLLVNGVLMAFAMFLTGDLAFLNSFYGLNPVASTHGNVWCVWKKDDMSDMKVSLID